MRLGVDRALAGGELVAGDVRVRDGRVAELGLPADGGGRTAAPGFVDLQVNGFAGVDLAAADTDGLARVGRALAATGVTAYLPTLTTAAPEDMLAALRTLAAAQGVAGARIAGVHLEGPFLAAERAGAHPVAHLRAPDRELLGRLLDAGPVRLVTLAPELTGADRLIRACRERGVVVAVGHTAATAGQLDAAADAGVAAVTHVLNATGGIRARAPGPAGAALARDDVAVTVIADGIHLHAATLRLVCRAAGGRLVLITDATAAAGRAGPEGLTLGGRRVVVGDGAVRRPDGTLAGSVLTMDRAVRTVVGAGLPLPAALAAASTRPGRLISDERAAAGLAVGAVADVAVLDDGLAVTRTLIGGRRVA